LREHDTEPTELSGGVLKVTIALWLLMPWQSLSPAFGAVSLIPEFWWSIFLMVVGVGHVAALRNGHPSWRRWGALVGFAVWCSLAITLLINGAVGLTPLLFFGAGFSQAWCYLRLGYVVRRS
jgi:hypothetical protein